MKIEISTNKRLMIQESKKKLLFSANTCRLYGIDDFIIEEFEEPRIKKHVFGKSETVIETHYYVTEMKVKSYHSTGKFCGYLTDDSVKNFLSCNDLYALRQNWIDLKDMVKAFGFDVVKIEETITEPEYNI